MSEVVTLRYALQFILLFLPTQHLIYAATSFPALAAEFFCLFPGVV
jgi:hypothetical protein